MKITHLTLNGKKSPVNVGGVLSAAWETDVRQTSFRAKIRQNGEIIADSGRVESALPLHTFQCDLPASSWLVLEVECQSAQGSAFASARFRTALTKGFPKDAEWITGSYAQNCEYGNPALYLTKTFEADGPAETYVHYAALGVGKLYINGVRVDELPLGEPFTDYAKRVPYTTVSVGKYLKKGTNEILLVICDGWYNQTVKDEWGFYKAAWRDFPKLLLCIEGGVRLVSDESWQASCNGRIVSSCMRLGERRDLSKDYRTSLVGALPAAPPAGVLSAEYSDPIGITEKGDFVSVTEYEGGYLVDFGKTFTGFVEINMDFDGGELLLRYGDRLENGRIYNDSNAQYVYGGEFQTDRIRAPKGRLKVADRFCYGCFRYVEVEGLAKKPEKGEIKAAFIRSAFERTGDFSCSDTALDSLYKAAIRSLECNFTGILTDCPHREKNGWTGDAHLSADALLSNFSCGRNLVSWLKCVEETALPSGKISCIAPTAGWGYEWGCGPAWDYALFGIPKRIYALTGDDYAVKRFYPAQKKYFSYVSGLISDGLKEIGLGDWNYPDDPRVEVAPTRLTDACYILAVADDMAVFAPIVGDDAQKYRRFAEDLRQKIRSEYMGKEGNSITAVACMLYFNVIPQTERAAYTDRLVSLLRRAENSFLFGITGAKAVFNSLCQNGRTDVFVELMRNPRYPSFYRWITLGADCLWEDFSGKNSRTHHMFSDIAAVMQCYVLGVKHTVSNDGVNVEIRPFLRDIGHICGKVPVPGGVVKAEFTVADGKAECSVDIPASCSAVLVLGNASVRLASGHNHRIFTL